MENKQRDELKLFVLNELSNINVNMEDVIVVISGDTDTVPLSWTPGSEVPVRIFSKQSVAINLPLHPVTQTSVKNSSIFK